MGALPKNKITRVERGKRRAGNKPSITKDVNQASIPLYKRGIVASILNRVGFSQNKSQNKKATTKTKKSIAKEVNSKQAIPVAKTSRSKPTPTVKTKTRRQTQHKG